MTIKEIIKKDSKGLVARAYVFAEQAHKGQKRKSGDPYFVHVLATAERLKEWNMDDATVAAGLLHDVVEDTGTPRETIVKEFGEEIAFLVDGVTKLSHIKYRGTEEKIENLRKMILALSKDLRVIFIKLADRLHNMQTLSAVPPQKQKRIALETNEIYAPIAYRLGMQQLSGELQDLAFPYIHPDKDKWLKKTAIEKYELRRQYLESVKPAVEAALHDQNITPKTIDFRAKRYSSLYQKLLRYDMNIDRIYDLVAMRIVVVSIEECYATLGLIHKLYPPLPGRIKDYIAMPKPNGYRSLHTTIIGPDGKMIEFQIRTHDMHLENEYGIAAHWLYKQNHGTSRSHVTNIKPDELRWVQQLRVWQENRDGKTLDPEEYLEAMKIDFFKDRIFAISPKGEVIDLPVGATPVDFAYHIHTAIGNTCVGAKVNGKIVALDTKLQSGDVVEILIQKNKKPSKDWFEFVKTSMARDHIRLALRDNFTRVSKLTPTKAELRIVVQDRLGLIKDISGVIARSKINIISFNADHQARGQFPADRIEINTTDKKKIESLILKLKKIKEIKEISYKLT